MPGLTTGEVVVVVLTGLALVVVGEAVVGSAVVVVVGTSHCWVLCLDRGEDDHSKAIKVVHVHVPGEATEVHS